MAITFIPASGMHVFRVETADGHAVTSRVGYPSCAGQIAEEAARDLFSWPHALPTERAWTAGEVIVTRYPDGEVTRWRVEPTFEQAPAVECEDGEDCDREDCEAGPAVWTVGFAARRVTAPAVPPVPRSTPALARPWVFLSGLYTGAYDYHEIMAAADIDGIGVLVAWTRQPDGSWSAWAVNNEAGEAVKGGEGECVPMAPPFVLA